MPLRRHVAFATTLIALLLMASFVGEAKQVR